MWENYKNLPIKSPDTWIGAQRDLNVVISTRIQAWGM